MTEAATLTGKIKKKQVSAFGREITFESFPIVLLAVLT